MQSFDGETLHNEYAGFLLRTKFEHVDEGGVASGFATLSSPFLL
jgi:glutathione synthase